MSEHVNDKQIGGDHYQAGFQHWDWILMVALPYLPATVTKYLTRWKKKNGIQDLEKSLHYLDKFIDDETRRHKEISQLTTNFINSNAIERYEARVTSLIMNYHLGDLSLLAEARRTLAGMLKEEQL